jgi:small conductance mechanosensitive channel
MQAVADFIEQAGALALGHRWLWHLLLGVVFALVGLWIARWWARVLDRVMLRFQVEAILRSFLRNVGYAIAVVVIMIAALDFIGVPTTSLLAVLGAAGLGIGLALKDSLSNIASGVMLIVLRPFHSGDHVQIAGNEGIIDQVRIFQTLLHTADNRLVILPNSQITNAPIVNFTARGERRLDLDFSLAYGDDMAQARQILVAAARDNARVHLVPAPDAIVDAMTDTRVVLQLRAWLNPEDYAQARSELIETILPRLLDAGMHLPSPTRELHVHHHDRAAVAQAIVDASQTPPA